MDNLNDYYDAELKKARLDRFQDHPGFSFTRLDLEDEVGVARLFDMEKPTHVAHLAAQVGVRYSIQNPRAYIQSNLVGFLNILEGCRKAKIEHLVFASSSSIYGANTKTPFSVHDKVDHPISLYAATKKSDELMAHSYSHLYDIPTTGLRFFTVYGPWGRPDMAYFIFTKNILEGKPISIFNKGQMARDFTYVDDIVEGLTRVLDRPAKSNPHWTGEDPDPASSKAAYRIYNIGNNKPVKLLDFIEILESHLGKKADKKFQPPEPGDVLSTSADISGLERDFNFRPRTSLKEGLGKFVEWYRSYYSA